MKARTGSCLDVDINHISKIFPRTTALDFVNCMNRILNLRVAACNATGIWEQMGVKLATVVLHNSPPPGLLPITIIQFTPHLLPIPLSARHCSQKGETPPTLQIFSSGLSFTLLFNQGFLHISLHTPVMIGGEDLNSANTNRLISTEKSAKWILAFKCWP